MSGAPPTGPHAPRLPDRGRQLLGRIVPGWIRSHGLAMAAVTTVLVTLTVLSQDVTTAMFTDSSTNSGNSFTSGTRPGWRQISVGRYHTCGVSMAGKAYCWGDDGNGRLGNGAVTADQDSPQPVVTGGGLTDTNVAAITAGRTHTCALTTTKLVYCWGNNSNGQLGTGTIGAQVATPTAVTAGGALTTSPGNVRAITASRFTTCAVTTTTNDAVCWGDDTNGELGNGGGFTASGSPTNVTTSTGMTAARDVGASGGYGTGICGITTTGKAYCWGSDSSGQAGNGATTGNQDSPSPVDTTSGLTDTNVAATTQGTLTSCAIITVTRKAYCWGSDSDGQLGNGTTTGNQTKPRPITLTP
ncbi:hypothetical protein ODJ79_45855 [Actinoplanes sp. KI2]|uniref:RCC1 domain-containing protein n=1 Tax=Actinoplanes sp. KI2 TaxID=2983315 RepID=UPI0021D58909|nr:hypothetical protein [Actinoplanes sp. KI2]MCU7731084.1 hypothetical protein [Actinoplanes sp. KI2]